MQQLLQVWTEVVSQNVVTGHKCALNCVVTIFVILNFLVLKSWTIFLTHFFLKIDQGGYHLQDKGPSTKDVRNFQGGRGYPIADICRHEGGRGLRNADVCISRKSFRGSQKSEKFDFSKCKNESVDHRFKSFAIN